MTALLAVMVLCVSTSSHAGSLPASLLGHWQVAEVHVNTDATWKMNYSWNDPRLRWRIFTFSKAQVIGDAPESVACELPSATVKSMGLSKLIGGSMAGIDTDPVQHATPAGYALKAGSDQAVDVISLTCRDGLWHGGLGADGGLQGAWMYIGADGRLALRWYDETILILTRMSVDTKPQASFDCAKAASPTEKAICGSLQLASFDRSVAASYADTRSDVKDDKALYGRVVSSQKAWVRQRNACTVDASCLLVSMKKRLDELVALDPG